MSNINLTDELKNEVKAKIETELKEKLTGDIGAKIKEQVTEQIKEHLESGISEEVKAEIKSKIKSEIKADLKNSISDSLKNEINEKLKSAEEVNKEVAEKVEEEKVEETTTEEAKQDKKGFTFKKGLLVYAGVWLIITIIVCIVLWSKMAGYQRNYDAAKAAANPDIVAGQIISLFSKENIKETAKNSFSELSAYESADNWNSFLSAAYKSDSLSYNRVENFSITNPEYEVYSGEVKLGSFKLTEVGDADKYGFHNYELKTTNVDLELPELKEYKITVLKDENVFINGLPLNEEPVIATVNDSVHSVAAEKSGKTYETATYTLTGFIEEPVVEVGGQKLEASDDNEFECYTAYSVEFMTAMSDRIYGAAETYIKVMNMVSGFGNVSGYLVANGNAYKAIQSAMSGLSWAGAPEEFNIKDSEIKELWQYDDNTFVVVTHHSIHRIYRGVTYEEEMTIECMYIQYNGNWYIQEMALKR